MGVPPSGSGCQPSAPAADASSRSGIPNAGEWAVFNDGYSGARVRQIAKVTPKIVKFSGMNWPRQCWRSDLMAALPTKESAEHLAQALNGAKGTRDDRCRKAHDEFCARKAAAWAAYEKAAAKLVASAIEAATAGEIEGLDPKGKSATPSGGDAQ